MKVKRHFILMMVVLLLASAASAQRDSGDRPSPGETGGSTGGPGMAGSAANAGREIQEIPGPSGAFTGGNPNGGLFPGSEVQFNSQASGQNGSGLDQRPQRGGQAGNENGSTQPDLDGFAPFSGEGTGLQSRFSERGSSTLALDGDANSTSGAADWQTQFLRGGFGAHAAGGTTSFETPPILDTTWDPNPDDGWSAPAAYSDLGEMSAAQQSAQAAVDTALQDVSEQSQTTADELTGAAQAAYDQFWADYYDVVDDTADAYYDTVTATYDTMLQSYQEAVDTTTQSVDYYLDYAEQYAYYCALYPWDCYSYAYDASVNTYGYVGGVSDAPVTTVEIGTVTAATSIPVASVPEPSADAYQALVLFANDQLGAVVEPRYAGVATDQVQALIAQLPAEMQASIANLTSISGETYWGLLYGGFASVMVGDCAAGNCTVTADNLNVQLSSSAAGAYGLLTNAAAPTTPEQALALITQVYPKLDGLAFAQVTDIDGGFAFTATAAGLGYDADTHQPVSAAKVVYAGVVIVNGQPFVYALVAVGEGYVALLP